MPRIAPAGNRRGVAELFNFQLAAAIGNFVAVLQQKTPAGRRPG
jgi:hypothetical protein